MEKPVLAHSLTAYSTPPPQVARLLWYLASISLALALLNIVPCYLLDGHHVAAALAQLLPLAPAARCGGYTSSFSNTLVAGTWLTLALGAGWWWR